MLRSERVQYPSDLSDDQWELIRKMLPPARPGGRPRTTDVRQVINAVFYLNRSGCAWRYLPREYPPWRTVYDYFRTWHARGVWRKIHDLLVVKVRAGSAKSSIASALIIDSQSVKAGAGEDRGYDGFKKIRGRKRQILTDTLGLVHAVKVHSARIPDQMQGHYLFSSLKREKREALTKIYADRGYRGFFVRKMQENFGIAPEIPESVRTQGIRKTAAEKRRSADSSKLPNLGPKRWVVERTIAWINRYRRLTRDYERTVPISEVMVYVAMTQLMLRRLQL